VAVSLMPQRVVVFFSAQWAFLIFELNTNTVLWTSKNVCSLHSFFLQMWNTITKLFIIIFWKYIGPTINPIFYVPHFAFSMILCTFCTILAKCP
jgi:hypothetical protein